MSSASGEIFPFKNHESLALFMCYFLLITHFIINEMGYIKLSFVEPVSWFLMSILIKHHLRKSVEGSCFSVAV